MRPEQFGASSDAAEDAVAVPLPDEAEVVGTSVYDGVGVTSIVIIDVAA